MGKSIREAYGEALVKYGKDDERVVVLDADVSKSTQSCKFAAAAPERFINCGICENAMTGIAAGLAAGGKIPFVNAFAVFLSTIGSLAARTYMSYSGLNIKFMGGYAGFSAGRDGSTHHAFEDLAVMRALPGVTVLVASDSELTDWIVKTAINTYGSMYVRLSREEAPPCHDGAVFELGKGCVVKNGTDATVIACGIQVSEALKAAKALERDGVSVRVVDMFCLKPLDEELIIACAKETGAIVTAEEHNVIGGLGAAVSQVLSLNRVNAAFAQVGMSDRHGESGGYAELLELYGLDAAAIENALRQVILSKDI